MRRETERTVSVPLCLCKVQSAADRCSSESAYLQADSDFCRSLQPTRVDF